MSEEGKAEAPEDLSDAKWDIAESVYSDAVVYPLCGAEQGVNWGERNHYPSTTLLLLCNYFMQLSIIYLLFQSVGRKTVLPDLFQTQDEVVRSSQWVWGTPMMKETGVCSLLPWESFNPSSLIEEPTSLVHADFQGNETVAQLAVSPRRLPRAASRSSQIAMGGGSEDPLYSHAGQGAWSGALAGLYWLDCRPDMVQYITAWEELDLNGDGEWTQEEAVAISARLERLFTNWMTFMRNVAGADPESQLSLATQDFTSMPQSVFTDQEYLFILCGILDPAKCSTLEERDVLKYIYPHMGHPIDRVDECEAMVGFTCKRILSADYRIYAIRHSQICGSEVTSRAFSGNLTMKKTEYSQALVWNTLIRSFGFALFITLILVIWGLAIFEEVRSVFLMAEMVYLFPASPTHSDSDGSGDETEVAKHVKTDSDGNTTILYFPTFHRLYIIFAVLIPRAVIVVVLAHIGSCFLASSQSFQDAIMNSLALTFVLDLDEMIYAGILAYRRKNIISNFQPLAMPYSIVGRDFGFFAPTLIYAAVVLGSAIAVVIRERTMPYGWIYKAEALACFCDLQGPSCKGFWELEATMGRTTGAAEIVDLFSSGKWLPRLPGWV